METNALIEQRTYARGCCRALDGYQVFDFGVAHLRELRSRLRTMPSFSIHAPLPTPADYPSHASTSFLLDPDPDKRWATLEMLRRTVNVAAQWGAQYVVVHFGGLHSDGLSRDEVLALAEDAASRLDALSRAQGMPLHVEYAAYNPSFSSPQELVELLAGYPGLDVCLDVGHARVGAQMLGLDEWEVLETLAPATRSIHLWTLRAREDVRRYRHTPAHPSLTPAGGWLDVPRVLDLVLSRCPACDVVLEHDTIFESDPTWLAEGEAWVRGLAASFQADERA
jgi:sugar phosphate isomerase/epimerase